MEPPEALEVRLSDVCRGCLIKTDEMTHFYPKDDSTSELIAMLSAVGNIEVDINEFLPSYLCKTCEDKLRASYEFQLLIQRSNEIIRECMTGTDLISEYEETQVEEKCVVAEAISIKVEESAKRIKLKPVMKPRKLPEFSPSEVEKAINECKEKFYINIECIKCGFVTSNNRALSVHMTHLHKDMKDRWCSICNSEVDVLSEHLICHAEDDFKCRFCGRNFMTKGHYTEHLRSHSSHKPYKCYVCHKGFVARRHLEKHMRIHTNNRLYKCPLCPGNFSMRSSLRSHIRNHYRHSKNKVILVEPAPDVKPPCLPQNFCKICKKRVRSLVEHLKKYHDSSGEVKKESEGVLCTLCGKKFGSLSRFRLHMRTHTGEAPYKCRYCDKRTTARNHMVVHERTHTGEKPHICNVCGKGFAQSSVLNTHMKIHTGRPEVCEICSKRFCRPAQLRLHMRKHTGEKPFQCTKCEQAFKQRSHLTEHLKTHSDERPYKCSHCDKGFKQISTLKSHIQIHLGKKPFKCSQCPYACRQSYSLTQHMKQHTADAPRPEKPHVCSLCNKGFSTLAMLTSHTGVSHSFA